MLSDWLSPNPLHITKPLAVSLKNDTDNEINSYNNISIWTFCL